MSLQFGRRIALIAASGLAIAAVLVLWADPSPKQLRGRLVVVNASRMHLVCTGAGSPPVILEGPQTGISAVWIPVQNGIAAFAEVCSYDRAGFGFSDPGPLPRTSANIAGELRALLRSASINPPYILVGASAGGFHVRVYAGSYPDDLAGVVLVDSSHPDQARKLRLPEDPTAQYKKWEPFFPLGHSLGIMKFGLKREKRPASFSPAEWSEVLDARNTVNSYRTVLREGEAWAESANQVRESADFGAKPLLVLTGARDADAELRALWVNGLQAELPRLSSKGRQTILENSGHGIMLEAPNAVVDGVRTIWNEARAGVGLNR
jgi:pimeloyl-ACP methyl ester carboxylesterase